MSGKPLNYRRHPDAWLAGVCADLAQRLGWNVLALRALAVLGLFIHALGTGALYLLLAIVLPLLRRDEEATGPEALTAPELGSRSARIAELERRFKDLEKGPGRGNP